MIVDALLSYVIYCNGSNAENNVRDKLDKFYSDVEVIIAKKALWAECETELGAFPVRHASINRSEKMPHINDIIEAIKKLDAKCNHG